MNPGGKFVLTTGERNGPLSVQVRPPLPGANTQLSKMAAGCTPEPFRVTWMPPEPVFSNPQASNTTVPAPVASNVISAMAAPPDDSKVQPFHDWEPGPGRPPTV